MSATSNKVLRLHVLEHPDLHRHHDEEKYKHRTAPVHVVYSPDEYDFWFVDRDGSLRIGKYDREKYAQDRAMWDIAARHSTTPIAPPAEPDRLIHTVVSPGMFAKVWQSWDEVEPEIKVEPPNVEPRIQEAWDKLRAAVAEPYVTPSRGTPTVPPASVPEQRPVPHDEPASVEPGTDAPTTESTAGSDDDKPPAQPEPSTPQPREPEPQRPETDKTSIFPTLPPPLLGLANSLHEATRDIKLPTLLGNPVPGSFRLAMTGVSGVPFPTGHEIKSHRRSLWR